MPQINQQVRSGNRVVIMFDGKQIGLLQSVSCSDDYGLEPANGIGDIHSQEMVPTVARHTVQVSSMILPKKSLAAAGITAENGDDALVGRVFEIEAYDKYTGELLQKYKGCSYASGSTEVRANAICMANGTFMALDKSGRGM